MKNMCRCVIVAVIGVQVIAWNTAAAQPGRPASAVLPLEAAQSRSARVSDVAYDLAFRLDADSAEFSGRVSTVFELTDAQDDLTLDFYDGTVATIEVNDQAIDGQYNGFYLTLPSSALRSGANRVEIEFSHPYSTDGSGLYRFRDPEDGRDYLYTDFEPYDQNRVFPSFDQPDLKARYSTRVTVPADWQVISIVRESGITEDGGLRTWTFPESAPISTYIYALHAGQYHSWQSTAGDIPLRLFARESLARYVRPDDWFGFTQQGFEFFQDYFDVPYAFGKYDQVIVPHFNAGAMENVGAVTFSERYLRRGAMTRQDRRGIASVILHEMAHMWFGDLVTMQWWNGLWLNESFATFMSTLAMAENTEFDEAWHIAYRNKVGAYRADERDTTHPIELPIADTNEAFASFDSITYNKGQAVLRQLNYLVGPESFRQGISNYLKTHAYGNTTIDDFLGAISAASGRDLTDWATDWLHEPGTNGIEVELDCVDDEIRSMAVLQSSPEEWPTMRTHRTQVGLYDFYAGEVSVRTVPATYSGLRTNIAEASGQPCPDFVYANHGDWDYARVGLQADILPTLSRYLGAFDDALTRSMLWQSVWDMVLDTRLSVPDYVEFALMNVRGETDDAVVRQVLGGLQSSLRYLIRLDGDVHLAELGPRIENYFWQEFLVSPAGADRQLLMFDNYVRAVTSAEGLERLGVILAGHATLPGGFDLDQDRRWSLLQALAERDHPGVETLLPGEIARDPSDLGRLRAVGVEAALPDPDRKRHWIDMMLSGEDIPVTLTEYRTAAGSLFPTHQHELQLSFAEEIFDRLAFISENRDPGFYRSVVGGLLGTVCDREYLARLEDAVNGSESLPPMMQRSLRDIRFEVERCLTIGETM